MKAKNILEKLRNLGIISNSIHKTGLSKNGVQIEYQQLVAVFIVSLIACKVTVFFPYKQIFNFWAIKNGKVVPPDTLKKKNRP